MLMEYSLQHGMRSSGVSFGSSVSRSGIAAAMLQLASTGVKVTYNALV